MGKPLAISSVRAAYLIARSEVSAAFATAESRPRRKSRVPRKKSRLSRKKTRTLLRSGVCRRAIFAHGKPHGETLSSAGSVPLLSGGTVREGRDSASPRDRFFQFPIIVIYTGYTMLARDPAATAQVACATPTSVVREPL